ncbi:MAG: SGNH family hydrolase [Pseudomonas sp.]|nr:SGNH family hydrolase [Pseudomonas sp.]
MHQDSLETYWQQSYHRSPPWKTLHTVAVWQAGTRVHTATISAWNSFRLEISGQTVQTAVAPLNISEQATHVVAAQSLETSAQIIQSPVIEPLEISQHVMQAAETTALEIGEESAQAAATVPLEKIEQPTNDCRYSARATLVDASSAESTAESKCLETLSQPVQFKQYAKISAGQRVFFAGDSMMQGVAPHLAVRLRREYGLSSIDLSRQSTGLAYPKSFNWPATIAQTLEDNPDIKLLTIFLGPNDPWDMPSGKGGKYLRYASSEWEALYRSRIRDIISSAQERNVDIIWVSSPYMRRQKLSTQVSYLNELYESEVLQAGEVFLSSNQVFQYPEATYSDYMGDGSLKQKMRSGDGIHFTPSGQRTLADALFDLIVFIPDKQAENDTQLATNTVH